MKYSSATALSIAKKIKKQFQNRLQAIAEPYQTFLAGLIGVEAGKTKEGFNESATRFEPHVYAALKKVKDGTRASYSGIERKDLKDASDDALKNLSKSWGATQIMGYHVIKNLPPGTTVEKLRDPQEHLKLARLLLGKVAGTYIEKGDFESAYRIWNTGSPTGKTHDPDYVSNAMAVGAAYKRLQSNQDSELSIQSAPDKLENNSEVVKVETVAAQIQEPPPYNNIGFWATIRRDLAIATGGNITIAGILDFLRNLVGLPDWIVPLFQTLAYGLLIATFGWFAFRVIHYAIDSWKQSQRVKQQIDAIRAIGGEKQC